MKKKDIIKKVILISIVLYFFLLSIKLMGGSFKLFGKEFAESLIIFTSNPFVALFIGILATSVMQSSSATTSLIVGLVASGALGVASAIPMIMGANIGTSITNTIVSLGHITNKEEFRKAFEVSTIHDFFNILAVLILFPLELSTHILQRSAIYLTKFFLGSSLTVTFTSPLDIIIKPVAKNIQHLLNDNAVLILIISLGLIFLTLRAFVKIMRPLVETEFKHYLHEHVFRSPVRTFLLGILLTIMVQSSSVTTSLVVPLAGVGIVSLMRIFPYILGANIGTTVTAFLAAIATGSPAALTIALTHLLFNLYGIAIVYPVRKFPIALSKDLARKAARKKIVPFAYIAVFFYLIPLFVIFFVR